MNKFFTMLKTELKLSIRGMDMIIFALCMPVVVVVILGVIYGNKPAAPGSEYTFYSNPSGLCLRSRFARAASWACLWSSLITVRKEF